MPVPCRIHAGIAAMAGGRAFQPFGSRGHPPGADAARRPGQGMRSSRRKRGRRPGDAPEHHCALAHEYLEDLALQAPVAKRHAPKMVLIDDARRVVPACRRHLVRYGHDFSPSI